MVHDHLPVGGQVARPLRRGVAPALGVDDDQRSVLAAVLRVDVVGLAQLLGVGGLGEDHPVAASSRSARAGSRPAASPARRCRVASTTAGNLAPAGSSVRTSIAVGDLDDLVGPGAGRVVGGAVAAGPTAASSWACGRGDRVDVVVDVLVAADGLEPRRRASSAAARGRGQQEAHADAAHRKGVPRVATATGSLTPMAHPSDRALQVLHTVRLKGFADAEPVARGQRHPGRRRRGRARAGARRAAWRSGARAASAAGR